MINSENCDSAVLKNVQKNPKKEDQPNEQRPSSKAPLRGKKASPIPTLRRNTLNERQANKRDTSKASQKLQGKKEFKEALKSTRNDKNSFCTVIHSSTSIRSVKNWQKGEASQNLRKPQNKSNGADSFGTSDILQHQKKGQ